MLDVMARARELDAFASQHDAQLAVHLHARGAAWSVGYIQQHARRHGFVPGVVPGRLVYPSTEEGAPPVLTLTFDSQAALADEPDRAAVRDVTLAFDVPQTDASVEPFKAWQAAAQALAVGMDAAIVDDDGRPLSGDGFAAIGAELGRSTRRSRRAGSRPDRRRRGVSSAEEEMAWTWRRPWASSCRSSRRRWPACRAAPWRSRFAGRRTRLAARGDARRGGAPARDRAPSAATDRPFNVNFSCHRVVAPDSGPRGRVAANLAPYFREYGLDARRDPERAGAIAVRRCRRGPGRGVPAGDRELPSRLARRAVARPRAYHRGAKILATATTVAEAHWLEHHGVDAIVVQGLEAGGHRGQFLIDDLTLQSGMFALAAAGRRSGAGCR